VKCSGTGWLGGRGGPLWVPGGWVWGWMGLWVPGRLVVGARRGTVNLVDGPLRVPGYEIL